MKKKKNVKLDRKQPTVRVNSAAEALDVQVKQMESDLADLADDDSTLRRYKRLSATLDGVTMHDL